MNTADLLRPADLVLDLDPPGKSRLMKVLARRAAEACGLDAQDVLAGLLAREDLGSTGIGNAVAVPHAAVAGLTAPFGMFVRLTAPMDFAAIDRQPVDLVFLLLLPVQDQAMGLNALSCVARQMRRPDVQQALRAAVDAPGLYAALTDAAPW